MGKCHCPSYFRVVTIKPWTHLSLPSSTPRLDLVKVVHGSLLGMERIAVQMAEAFEGRVSKKSVYRKLKDAAFAVKELRVPYHKRRWFVKPEVLAAHGLEALPLPEPPKAVEVPVAETSDETASVTAGGAGAAKPSAPRKPKAAEAATEAGAALSSNAGAKKKAKRRIVPVTLDGALQAKKAKATTDAAVLKNDASGTAATDSDDVIVLEAPAPSSAAPAPAPAAASAVVVADSGAVTAAAKPATDSPAKPATDAAANPAKAAKRLAAKSPASKKAKTKATAAGEHEPWSFRRSGGGLLSLESAFLITHPFSRSARTAGPSITAFFSKPAAPAASS